MIQADDGAVGRNHNNIQPVNFQKFLSRSQGGTGHARELLVKSEIVLEGNRAGRTSFFFNFSPLFGLDGLMNPFRPASARLEPPGERIYNNNFSLFNLIILALFQLLGDLVKLQIKIRRILSGGRNNERSASLVY